MPTSHEYTGSAGPVPSVSIVMATYNGAEFVAEQLASLGRQTQPPLELIVSDDGSTDCTLEIVEAFARSAPFEVYINRNSTNLGYGENFLRAARLARGDLIAFCDQDDVWHPDKIGIAARRIWETGALLLLHPAIVVDGDGNRVGDFVQNLRRAEVLEPCSIGPWAVAYGCMMVFHSSLIKLFPLERRGRHTFEYDKPLSHDLWVVFLATSLGRTVVDGRGLVEYRQHGRNVTPSVRSRGFRQWTTSLGTAASTALARDEIALERAALLTTFAVTHRSHELASAARRAGRYWAIVAAYERIRLRVYEAGVVDRASSCLLLVVRGAYRSHRRGGLGARIFLKDVLAGVVAIRRRS